MSGNKKDLIFIIGPTAVGKSEIACQLTKKINAEIISADSMQVYKGLPIITASPSGSIIESCQHHLIGTLALSKEYNVVKFLKAARKKISQIIKKNKVPLVVGGSGFYINVLLDGAFEGPGEDKQLREKLKKQADKFGNNYIYEKLAQMDPGAALRIHPNNLKRLIRALEICIKTGKKMAELKKQYKGIFSDYNTKIIGLKCKRNELYRRIESRVEEMFENGAVKEVRKALMRPLSKTARQIIGIKEIAGLINQEYNEEEAKRLIKRNTRHFAKRQLAWFKRDKRIHWIKIKENETSRGIVKKILGLLN